MENECSSDNQQDVPPVPIKTYQWEDLKRERDRGAYPWTHLKKPVLEGEITAEDILRESTPRRSMSRDVSRERSRTPLTTIDGQKLLNLSSSPGSSRRHNEDGNDSGANIPNFSKEITTESEEDPIDRAIEKYIEAENRELTKSNRSLHVSHTTPRSISPKGILKRRLPDNQTPLTVSKSEKTKCCHPLVNKIKHIAERTLQKQGKSASLSDLKKSKVKNEPTIRVLKSSPSDKRKKFAAIRLGSSDEVSKTLSTENRPISTDKRDHIYEDVDTARTDGFFIQFSPNKLKELTSPFSSENTENVDVIEVNKVLDSIEKTSMSSNDPSLSEENVNCLKQSEHIMETLHKHTEKEALVLEEDRDQTDKDLDHIEKDSPNITITEIEDDDVNNINGSIKEDEKLEKNANRSIESELISEWSKSSSDHEYELVGKSQPETKMQKETIELKSNPDDLCILSDTDKNNHQNLCDENDGLTEEDIQLIRSIKDKMAYYDNADDEESAEMLQKDIESRYFTNTPSPISRTECEVSTSQVDSSALENLPLKRENRNKNNDAVENSLQQRFKEQTGKLKNQAGKLKNKLQTLRTRQFSMPERPRFQLPERPKINFPDMPKFSLPDRRKFSLPDRPKVKKITVTEKLRTSDRKKFSLPEKPKFNMPEFPKFKVPERVKFKKMGRRKNHSVEFDTTSSATDLKNVATVEFESSTYPRAFSSRNKSEDKVSSSPTLYQAEPSTFGFDKISKNESYHQTSSIPSNTFEDKVNQTQQHMEKDRQIQITVLTRYQNVETAKSLPDVSSQINDCPHVINEINNDEFFVRPKGISRENIQVRQYLSDEIREAFRVPVNSLAAMGSQTSGIEDNFPEFDADPAVYFDDDDNKQRMENDDGYYTFPPLRPNRKKKKMLMTQNKEDGTFEKSGHDINNLNNINIAPDTRFEKSYEFHTLPYIPKRKKKKMAPGKNSSFTSLSTNKDFKKSSNYMDDDQNDVVVFRTEHEYIVPDTTTSTEFEQSSPVPPFRNKMKSRTSHFTDEDRTSHGAESLASDTHVSSQDNDSVVLRQFRHESPGYATVDKNPVAKPIPRRSKSKTPPVKRRKSYSNDQKFYTVDRISRSSLPNRPPRKRSSTSLMTLNSLRTNYLRNDSTQYVEIDDTESLHKNLFSGDVINKMKDRPLPPPPRPPRITKKEKSINSNNDVRINSLPSENSCVEGPVAEVEACTQTDPLPDDIDFELGIDETIDISISSSIRDDDDEYLLKTSLTKLSESPRNSRPTSRSESSSKITDPKLNELAKNTIGRSSPTVILVEKRVSSPTRINERDVILTEASLTVQPIDSNQSQSTKPLPSGKPKEIFMKSVCENSEARKDNQIKNSQSETAITETQSKQNITESSQSKTETSLSSSDKVELSQNAIDEIVKKVAEITTHSQANVNSNECQRPMSREEETQTDACLSSPDEDKNASSINFGNVDPPQRPPPPELTPFLYSYLQEMSVPPNSFYQLRTPRDRPFTEFFDSQTPPPPLRRSKRKQKTRQDDSSSDEQRFTQPRRVPHSSNTPEPATVTEAGAQFLRACQNSLMRTVTNIFQALMSYISGSEEKKDVQMALVIFLVLIAGLIMFGLSDGRTIHHHHWEFFNPPDNNKM